MGIRMFTLRLNTGSRFETIKKWLAEGYDVSAEFVSIEEIKVKKHPSRADRVSEAADKIRDGGDIAEEIKGELESWKDNLPESFQDKADELDTAIDALDTAVTGAEEAAEALDGIEMPGAFGR